MSETTTALGLPPLTLGEGPVWDPQRAELSVVDIFGRAIYRLGNDSGNWRVRGKLETDGDVGAALPIGSGRFLTCESGGIFIVDEASREFVFSVPGGRDGQRCNDAKIAPDGSLYVGVMDYEATEGAGSLWRVDRSGHSTQLLDGLTIPNGLDWWGDEFWFVDGPTPRVSCYRWGSDGLTDTGHSITTSGVPDGLSIDQEGRIWLALWDEGRVDCLERTGERVSSVSVAAPQSTSVAWCGSGLTTLAVTSASYGYGDDEYAAHPQAGSVFFVEPGATGRLSSQLFG